MSYDLEIATHQQPERRDIDDALPEEVTLSGVFGTEGNLVVQGHSWSCEIDGPLRCEPDDLQEALCRAVVAPQWLLQIHVPLGDPIEARKIAARIATHVARARLGAVYDPQQDRVVYPRGGKRPKLDRHTDRVSRTLQCEWCYAPDVLGGKAEEFLSVAASFLPEVIPTRFGTFEPLQHRLEKGQREFVALWERESTSSGSLFWKCKAPGLGGGVNWPFDNEANAELGGLATANLSIELEGDVLTTDARWRAAVTAFFRAMSVRTEAFYGRATLSPPTPDQVTAADVYDFFKPGAAFRGRWFGVPRHPAWLTWLGRDYSVHLTGTEGPASTHSTAQERLFVQDENLDANSALLLEGVDPAVYRVPLNGEPTSSREKLSRDTAFGDAKWLPPRLRTLP